MVLFIHEMFCTFASMIYPQKFEQKIGFTEIKSLLRQYCLSAMGKEMVDAITFSTDTEAINNSFSQVREMRKILSSGQDFPFQGFADIRQSVARVRLEGTHMEEDELFELKRCLQDVTGVVAFLSESATDDDSGDMPRYTYPALHELADGIATFPKIVNRINQVLDKFGRMRDNASPALAEIRREKAHTQGSISNVLNSILRQAQTDGVVSKDITPTMRDGRLVIPVAPALKRKIQGIVHDESASGRTVFVEPTQVVEANNRIRELEAKERREIIKILTEISKMVRPYTAPILDSLRFLANIDFVMAKARWSEQMGGFEPNVQPKPYIDFIQARHPLLQHSLEREHNGKKVVPLDIMLTPQKRILIISGPNAGGKSVCLKSVGLLQYMIQCGISPTMSERSAVGTFQNIMIDIGDEQSIENDLSTYSSHLVNMKNMIKGSNGRTLLLIDEFGTGTEPQIGGAIAESVLKQFCKNKAWGVITTHYQNLKHYADAHPMVVNGAMLYDRKEMRPLFQLAIGQPGSSFAIEIARKTGLPEEVIKDASEIVGSDYIQSDKYLQDIVRDKRYWESKRQKIHQDEKTLETAISHYQEASDALKEQRKQIIGEAKSEAERLIQQSNKQIENVIKEIKEHQADKEKTKEARQKLEDFRQNIAQKEAKALDDKIVKKMQEIATRKQRHEKRMLEKAMNKVKQARTVKKDEALFAVGDTVKLKGTASIGQIETIEGKSAWVIFGGMRSRIDLKKLEHAQPAEAQAAARPAESRVTRATIDEHKSLFHPEIDVRGMRGDEALEKVKDFIDNAILVGVPTVRILHGKGNGILRQLIRQYLSSIPNVTSFRDEHVQFGGAGITVAEIG